jgi:hypothetical protein
MRFEAKGEGFNHAKRMALKREPVLKAGLGGNE